MYVLAVILRHLRRKLAPLAALAAVTLCCGMVILCLSVMSGFLRMMETTTRALEGDLTLSADERGIARYEELLAELRGRTDLVVQASPVAQAYGLVKLPDGVHKVQVLGVEPQSVAQVVNYEKSLFWTREHFLERLDQEAARHPPTTPAQHQAIERHRQRILNVDPRDGGRRMQVTPQWLDLTSLWIPGRDPGPSPSTQPDETALPAIVPGIEVSRANRRDRKGRYHLENNLTLGKHAVLSVVVLTDQGAFESVQHRRLVVVNEFKSGLFEIDANRVYVHFNLLQQMLGMTGGEEVDDDGKPTGRRVSARANMILVKGRPDVPLPVLQAAVRKMVDDFQRRHPDLPSRVVVQNWRERHATFLSAVENERSLVVILFTIISLVAIIMILVVFSMIVVQKTRDIGALRAMGASREGVASIFLGYGLAVGVVGSALGVLWSSWLVHNINEVQDFSAKYLGFEVWRYDVYYFDRIPNQVNLREVAWVVAATILSSVVGAVVPAIRAAMQDPVEPLRYE